MGTSNSSVLAKKKESQYFNELSFIKNAVVFSYIKHRFRMKFPNFSGVLGFRYILYIFSARFSVCEISNLALPL